jgi:hypothetical protein
VVEQGQASRPGIRPVFVVAIVVVAVIVVFLLGRGGDKKPPVKPSAEVPTAGTSYTRPDDRDPAELESPPADDGEADEDSIVYDDPSVPRKTIDVDTVKEEMADRDPNENVPTPKESIALMDRVLDRLEGELAAAQRDGDTAKAHRLEVRIARIKRQRADKQKEEAAEAPPAGGDAGPSE